MAYRQPVSTIMLCRGYPCDREHENTLYFASKSAQWTYMKSLVKYTYSAQSYQRYAKNTLRIAQRADDLYDCNYLIFSNSAISTASTPSDSTPIFYAFIDKVEYINENCTEVTYTLDDLQTFWFNFSMGECYVEREHTETDYRYGNLVPEDKIEIKSYYNHELDSCDLTKFSAPGTAVTSSLWSLLFIYVPNNTYISGVTSYVNASGSKTDPDNYLATPSFATAPVEYASLSYKGEIKNATYTMARFLFVDIPPFSAVQATLAKIRSIMSSAQAVFDDTNFDAQLISVVLVPRIFAQNIDSTAEYPVQWYPSDAATATFSIQKEITRPTLLYGPNNATYTPRNKKLLSYPFCSVKVDNNNGDAKEYAWEYIDGISAVFLIKGVVTGAPEVVAYPSIYNGDGNKYADNGVFIKNFIDTLWSQDSYQAYLNANANSISYGFITSAISAVAQAYAGNYGGAVGTLVSEGGTMAMIADRSSLPDKITGSMSYSALRNVLNCYKYSFDQMNVYPAAAERIDKYFDMYGYAVNTVKVPNIKATGVTLRPHWNYVKTNGAVVLPASNSSASGVANSASVDELEAIKKIFDRGVRFWTTPSEVGKYSSYNNSPT